MDDGSAKYFTYGQLRAGGLDDGAIRARLREGTLVRLRRGAYAMTGQLTPLAEHIRLIHATMPSVDPGNVLSHHSAGVLHNLPVPQDSLNVVSMTRRTKGHAAARASLRVHASALEADEVGFLVGLPVTSLARTTFDVTRTVGYPRAVAVADAALRAGLPREELNWAIERHKGFHGRARARLAADFADPRSESPAESLSRVQFALHGVPAPELQFEVVGAGGVVVARTDFAWPELRLVGEIDGKWKYGELLKPGQTPQDAIMDEKRREELIREAGYWIVRWDWKLALDGARLAERVLRVMATQRRYLAS